MKWNNTYKVDNSILFSEALTSKNNSSQDNKNTSNVLKEYKTFFKECNKLIKKVSNYFDNNKRLNRGLN